MALSAIGQLTGPAESTHEHFLRLGWVEPTRSGLRITPIGKALIKALDEQRTRDEAVATIVLEPDDPLAVARVLGKLAALGEVMLVEPYFRLDDLLAIVQDTKVTRVLMGEKTSEAARTALSRGVRDLEIGRKFEIRVAEDLHDRHVIPVDGPVHFIGTSLRGRAGRARGQVYQRFRWSMSLPVMSTAVARQRAA
jgi:hypothetical protein